MRSLTFATLAFGLLILANVSAQQPGRGFGGGGASALLQMKEVQKELSITEEQGKAIAEKSKEMRTALTEKFGNLREMSKEDREAKMPEVIKFTTEETKKILDANLKPEQTKRLNQLVVQQAGILGASNNAEASKALSLTDEQKEKLKTMSTDMRAEAVELFKGGKEGFAKIATLRKETTAKALGVLTAEQKKTWEELNGAKFEFPEPRGFGGGNKDKKKVIEENN